MIKLVNTKSHYAVNVPTKKSDIDFEKLKDVVKNVVRIVKEAIPNIIESITKSLPEILSLGGEILNQIIISKILLISK